MSSIIKVDAIQKADGTTPTAKDLGLGDSGSIINVHRMNYNTQITTTSANWTNSGLTLTVTPRDANSKFYLQAEVFWLDSGQTGWQGGYARWLRNGTVVFEPTYSLELGSAYSANHFHRNTASYLDTPATTSAITYSVQLYNYHPTGTYWHYGGGNSYLTAFEIAG